MSGSLFAMRRSLWRPLDTNLGDDFLLPLRVARAGIRNVIEAQVAASTSLSQTDPEAMLRLKVRVISKDLRALLANPALLNPIRYGGLAIGLWSHKLLRWFVPYFLLALLASNFWLLDKRFLQIASALQAAFYALAGAGLGSAWPRRSIPLVCADVILRREFRRYAGDSEIPLGPHIRSVEARAATASSQTPKRLDLPAD